MVSTNSALCKREGSTLHKEWHKTKKVPDRRQNSAIPGSEKYLLLEETRSRNTPQKPNKDENFGVITKSWEELKMIRVASAKSGKWKRVNAGAMRLRWWRWGLVKETVRGHEENLKYDYDQLFNNRSVHLLSTQFQLSHKQQEEIKNLADSQYSIMPLWFAQSDSTV